MGFKFKNFIKNPVGFVTGSQAANRRLGNSVRGANARLDQAFKKGETLLNPFIQSSNSALGQINRGLAQGGQFTQGFQSDFNPDNFGFQANNLPAIGNPNVAARLPATGLGSIPDNFSSQQFAQNGFNADPGFQFRLNQGQAALERSAAARGKALSGQAAQALTRFGQNLASQEFSAARNRALQENQLAFNRGRTLNNTSFDRASQQAAVRRALAAGNFDRSLNLNNTLRNRQLQQNQLAFDRARSFDRRRETRFDRAQQQRFNRLAQLLGLGANASTNLADLAARSAGAQGGNLLTAGQLSAQTALSDRQFLLENAPKLIKSIGNLSSVGAGAGAGA